MTSVQKCEICIPWREQFEIQQKRERKQRIAIIGASANREKFGNKAVRAYMDEGWVVFPINPHEEHIEGMHAYASVMDVPWEIDYASLYVPAKVGMKVIEEVARKEITKVYFNPGSESDELVAKAKELGLQPLLQCSIIAVGRSPSEY